MSKNVRCCVPFVMGPGRFLAEGDVVEMDDLDALHYGELGFVAPVAPEAAPEPPNAPSGNPDAGGGAGAPSGGDPAGNPNPPTDPPGSPDPPTL